MRRRFSFARRGTGAARLADKQIKYPIVGQVNDVDGVLWNIRDARDTKHGFDLYFGTPARNRGSYRGGLPRLIATKALRDFWDANRTKGDGILYDLPAGRSTLKRVRHRLGFNFVDDRAEYWTDRIDDLTFLPAREFAAKHGVELDVAVDWRFRLLGSSTRAMGWWRKPKILKILLSDLTLSQVGLKLGISISQANRLRHRAKLESH